MWWKRLQANNNAKELAAFLYDYEYGCKKVYIDNIDKI